MNSILVVEDDQHIQEMLLYILQKEGFDTNAVSNAEDALAYCLKTLPDLILLDIQLPGINGYVFCEKLANNVTTLPKIIMLTDQAEVSDIERGLNNYADDFIAKPFNPRILIARINANLRRSEQLSINNKSKLAFAEITIDVEERHAYVSDQLTQLQKMEFDILTMLVATPNKVHSREEIITYCKGDNYFISDRAIDNQIYKLRKKLGPAGKYLTTVSGVGYRLTNKD